MQQDRLTMEVTTDIDPDIFDRPPFNQVPDTRLSLTPFGLHPQHHELLFDHTIAQRIRFQQLIDEAWKNENDQDYYDVDLGILETEEDKAVLAIDGWQDIMVEVTLDSGACRNVMPRECAPDYPIQDSNARRRGLAFVSGNGERVPKEDQFIFNLGADNGRGSHAQLAPTFQVAELTLPLMSVSQIYEQGFQFVFKDTHALDVDQAGETVCRFER